MGEVPERREGPGDGASYRAPARTDLRRVLENDAHSAAAKYRALAVGRPGIAALLGYELRTALLGGLPGAAGYFLRQRFYPRLFGHWGRGVVIGRGVTVRHPHRIRLGDRVMIDDYCVLDGKGEAETTIELADDVILGRNSVLSCKDGTIRFGARTNVSVNCTFISESWLELGDRVLVGGHGYLIAGGNHGTERTDVAPLDQPRLEKGGLRIADNCWLGAQVTVLDGVEIGHDSVIAAGAVVTRSLPPLCVAGGVPAGVIRMREGEAQEAGS